MIAGEVSVILLNEYCYSEEDYKKIRVINRESFKKDSYSYCKKQVDFIIHYEISVNGVKYFMSNFFKGLPKLRQKYKVKIANIETFSELYALGNRLPSNIDYVLKFTDSETFQKAVYLSRKARFTYTVNSVNEKIVVDQGTTLSEQEIRKIADSINI